jgi:hypothetical protein
MAQIFSHNSNTISQLIVIGIILAVFAVSAIAISAVHSPYLNGQDEQIIQPIPFSHKHHVQGLGLDCQFCHSSVENSSHAGFPDTTTCMTCHSEIWTNAKILEPVRQSFFQKKPLHWIQVYQTPDHVYFDHSIHIHRGIACKTCHGEVERMPVVFQARTFFMKDCLECHEHPQPYFNKPLPLTNCNVCHR